MATKLCGTQQLTLAAVSLLTRRLLLRLHDTLSSCCSLTCCSTAGSRIWRQSCSWSTTSSASPTPSSPTGGPLLPRCEQSLQSAHDVSGFISRVAAPGHIHAILAQHLCLLHGGQQDAKRCIWGQAVLLQALTWGALPYILLLPPCVCLLIVVFRSRSHLCPRGKLAIFCTPCRYFLHIWPELAFLAYDSGHCLGTVVCKMDRHKCTNMMRGYLAMLVVEKPYRALGVGERRCYYYYLLLEACAAALALRKSCRAVEWVNSGAARLGRLLGQAGYVCCLRRTILLVKQPVASCVEGKL